MDLMIASIAISNKTTLFTNNLKHFKKIENLEILEL
jgi:predicted nucleic acid-binding protein